MAIPSFIWIDPASGGRIYVSGSRYEESDLDALGITTVIAAVDPQPFVAGRPGITLVLCPFPDRHGAVPAPRDELAAMEAGASALRTGQGVLVHCGGGYNRSPYLAARILGEMGVPPLEAVHTLLRRRSNEVLLNEGLAIALIGRPVTADERGEVERRRR